MKTITLKSNIQLCKPEELSDKEQTLIKKAIEATKTSYAKYSNFKVGASVLLSDGKIVTGSNQENASFSMTMCAERNTIFAANAMYPDNGVVTICIAAKNVNDVLLDKPITPCGACRQVILEEEERYKHPVKILLYGTEGVYVVNTVRDILPLAFIEEDMK